MPDVEGSSDGDVPVLVKAADREVFEKFVDMYFPSCEVFIMDYVAYTPKERTAGS